MEITFDQHVSTARGERTREGQSRCRRLKNQENRCRNYFVAAIQLSLHRPFRSLPMRAILDFGIQL